MQNDCAPGQPGISPKWTSSAKSGVGTSIRSSSRVWFTIGHGIVNEVYYPEVDLSNIRDFGLLVASGSDFFSEEKRSTRHEIEPFATGIPGFTVTNTCTEGRYKVVKTVFTDPMRDVLLQHVSFKATTGELADYRLYALLAPHITDKGNGNTAWTGSYKGVPILFARRADVTLAMACSEPWLRRSCGFVGVSDGWRQVNADKKLTHEYICAEEGNVALTGEVDLKPCGGDFVIALAFGENETDAAEKALASLLEDFDTVKQRYISEWSEYQSKITPITSSDEEGFDLYRGSVAVLKSHEGKQFPGGLIASLSFPWGATHGDGDEGGYHVVWPRDQVEAAGALLAAGDANSARQTLNYLISTQEPDGHWPQNMWLNGEPYWPGIQVDETAFTILLVDLLGRCKALDGLDAWPAVRKAAEFIAIHGPSSEQDRWEENSGFSPFTLAAEVSALLAASGMARLIGETTTADYLLETADSWNASIEEWTYVTDTDLAREVGVDGYYMRIAPPETAQNVDAKYGNIKLKNRRDGDDTYPAWSIVSPDALALVRFGLRAADDPKILNTIKVIDATLKSETSNGPVWHRYNHDGYGEHADGEAYDGAGIGRGWPLLVGERAHYELAAGNVDKARSLIKVMTALGSPEGLLPEQAWDSDDIPEKELFNGCPSGSAMPLVWAHSEYIKLARSIRDGVVFDTPPDSLQRYASGSPTSPFVIWRFDRKRDSIPAGKTLRLEVMAHACVRWSADNWTTAHGLQTKDTGLGIYAADLPTSELPPGGGVKFTFCWTESDRWEGKTFESSIYNA